MYDEYDEKEISPKAMSYWQIISVIAKHNNIDIKEAIKRYYNLTGVPKKDEYEALMTCNNLLPCCVVKVIQNLTILEKISVPYSEAGLKSEITDIDIDLSSKYPVAYLLKDSEFYFLNEMLIPLK